MSLTPPPLNAAAPRGPFAGFWPAFTWGVKLTVGRRRRMLIVSLVAVGVGLLAGWFAGHTERGTELSQERTAFQLWRILHEALLPFCAPLVALTLVAGAFQREVSERTLVFHLVRPIARRTLFLARFLAAVLVAIPIALLTPLAALWISGLPLPPEVYLSLVPTVGLGVLAVGALTYLLSAWFKHGIVASLIYVFLVDSFLNEANGTMQRLSTLHHVLSLHHRGTDAAFAALSGRVSKGTDVPLEGFDPSSVVFSTLEAKQLAWMESGAAALVLASVTVLALALGAWKVTRRDYPLKD